MKKISVILLALIFSLCCLFVGCRDNSVSEDGRKIIRVAILGTQSEQSAMNKVKKAFEEKNKEYKIVPVTFGASYNDSIFTFLQDRNPPDIFWTAGDSHYQFSKEGIFEPLNEYIERDNVDLSDFYPSMLEITKLTPESEEMYFMPRDYNKVVMVYNKNIFDAAELDYPDGTWDWDDFLSVCQTLRAKMDANTDPANGLAEDCYPIDARLTFAPVYYPIITGFGGDILNEDHTASALTTSATESAVEKIYEIVDKRYSIAPASSSNNIFFSNKAAMYFTVRPDIPVLFTSTQYNIDFAPFPEIGEDAPVGVGCSGYAINAASKNKDAAWEFLKFIGSVEGQKVFGQTGSGVPVLQSLANDACWTTDVKAGLNHNAFVDGAKRDIQVNYANKIEDGGIQSDIVATMGKFFMEIHLIENLEELRQSLSLFDTDINNLIKG